MPNINKNIIKQAGAAVANATNKAAGLSASTPEPGTIISAIQLVNGGRKIGPADVVHFTESVRNKLLSLLVSMEPIQDFNGYGHPWPAGGGKNLFDADAGSNGYINDSGAVVSRSYQFASDYIAVTAGSSYTISAASQMSNIGIAYFDSSKAIILPRVDNASRQTLTITPATGVAYVRFWFFKDTSIDLNPTDVKETYKVQFEAGASATSYAPYSNICPISGRTGANAYVSPTPNVSDATTYAADWATPAGTVYAGSADIVTGDIKAAPYYASYNGETLVGPWISSMDEYDPEGTPTTGAQVVDLGGTMNEYHITGQDIITLVGDNYIWSDSGDVTITE